MSSSDIDLLHYRKIQSTYILNYTQHCNNGALFAQHSSTSLYSVTASRQKPCFEYLELLLKNLIRLIRLFCRGRLARCIFSDIQTHYIALVISLCDKNNAQNIFVAPIGFERKEKL